MKRLLLLINKPIGELILSDLISRGADIRGIVTEEKDGVGWWKKTNIRDIAKDYKIPLYDTHRNGLPVNQYDVAISIQYGKILEADFINAFDHIINLHFAELPRYRGMNSSAHTIINARKDDWWRSGVTLHYIDAGIDTGRIIETGLVEIDDMILNKELYEDLEDVAWELYKMYVDYIVEGGHVMSTPQRALIDKDHPSYYYYKNSLQNKEVEFGDMIKMWDVSRALYFPPFEPAYTVFGRQKYYVIPSVVGEKEADITFRIIGTRKNRLYLYKEIPSWYYD